MDSPGTASIADLLDEYERALGYTDALWRDLTPDQVRWRESDHASGIGWHLGHQAAVAHFMIRNLTAAEPSIDPQLDHLMDSATPEIDRGDLPDPDRLARYRDTVAERVRVRVGDIARGDVGAPGQLAQVATTLVATIVNHEYQHSQWIAEVRRDAHGLALPPRPTSPRLTELDGYLVLARQ